MNNDDDGLTVDDVYRASERIGHVLAQTPLVYSYTRQAFLKLENMQRTGAFKIRGALNAITCQVQRGDRRAVVAASAGNHALGVAWSCHHWDLPAHLIVPVSAPENKVAGCRRLGATVVRHGASFDEAEVHARELATENDWYFLHAFDNPEVIAGQGTVALELLDARPDVVVLPIGGGSLAAGMATVLKPHGIRVVGVQVAGMDTMARALKGKTPRPLPEKTVADGLRVARPGRLTRKLCESLLDDVVLVSEEEVRRTIVDLIACEHVSAEGAGATAVAALPAVEGEKKIAIVSGGNLDNSALYQLLYENSTGKHFHLSSTSQDLVSCA